MSTALAAFVLAGLALAPGDPFTTLGYEAALAQAKQGQKLLLVDFTASWCPPCKKMEKDTWGAADVRAWLKDNAIAVQIDVDLQRSLAERFKIEAMPTVIALRDGAEFDRFVGYRDPAQFLTWARDVRAGKRPADALLERSKALRESTDIDARYRTAKELQEARLYDEALVHYLWLWPATRGTSYAGVRASSMLKDMADLARVHEPAKKAFDEIFSDLQKKIDAADLPASQDWREWSAFCKYFGSTERIVAWYEKHRDEQGRLFAQSDDPAVAFVQERVFELLMQRDRPLDAVQLYPDARQRAAQLVEEYGTRTKELLPDDETRKDYEDYSRHELIDGCSALFGALLVAGRTEEANAVAELLLRTLDTPNARLGLVRAAVEKAQKPHPDLARWLDEAEAAGGNVRSLRKSLARLTPGAGGK